MGRQCQPFEPCLKIVPSASIIVAFSLIDSGAARIARAIFACFELSVPAGNTAHCKDRYSDDKLLFLSHVTPPNGLNGYLSF